MKQGSHPSGCWHSGPWLFPHLRRSRVWDAVRPPSCCCSFAHVCPSPSSLVRLEEEKGGVLTLVCFASGRKRAMAWGQRRRAKVSAGDIRGSRLCRRRAAPFGRVASDRRSCSPAKQGLYVDAAQFSSRVKAFEVPQIVHRPAPLSDWLRDRLEVPQQVWTPRLPPRAPDSNVGTVSSHSSPLCLQRLPGPAVIPKLRPPLPESLPKEAPCVWKVGRILTRVTAAVPHAAHHGVERPSP